MQSSRDLAGHAARLLGTGATAAAAPRAEGLALLAGQVADALGVARPAGQRTLHAQDNVPLRLLLEERRLLGSEGDPAALDAALRAGSLILAAHGTAGVARPAARGVSVLLSNDGAGAVCVFTHDAALRRFAAGAPVTAWVTESAKVWLFALQVLRREVLLDPGEPSELRLGESRLRRLLA
jgi:hypothetical protein